MSVGAFIGSSTWSQALAQCTPAQVGVSPYGALLPADANGIMLPAGFESRVIASGNQEVGTTGHIWHTAADGGATFRSGRGWIYVSNSETAGPVNVSAIRFDRFGEIVDSYPILFNTNRNCAGGATPWRTWLSCEEFSAGRVWECDPEGVQTAQVRPAMGVFSHEAVAVDRRRRQLFLTEDRSNGLFYRFLPNTWGDLSSGVLEAAGVDIDGNVTWYPVPDPSASTTSTRLQVPQATPFNGGEGITYHRGHIYFTTKGDNSVWDYDARRQTLVLLYAAGQDSTMQLTGVDNITGSKRGDLLVAEDGGNMEIVLISPDREVSPLLRITGQGGSEITGPAFAPRARGSRLYFSSQRGGAGGITYEVTGPFRRRTPRRTRC